MLLILLNNLLRVCVILQDLFILTPCQKDVLLIVRRVKFHTEWGSSICEATNHFACFSVPKLNNSVVAS